MQDLSSWFIHGGDVLIALVGIAVVGYAAYMWGRFDAFRSRPVSATFWEHLAEATDEELIKALADGKTFSGIVIQTDFDHDTGTMLPGKEMLTRIGVTEKAALKLCERMASDDGPLKHLLPKPTVEGMLRCRYPARSHTYIGTPKEFDKAWEAAIVGGVLGEPLDDAPRLFNSPEQEKAYLDFVAGAVATEAAGGPFAHLPIVSAPIEYITDLEQARSERDAAIALIERDQKLFKETCEELHTLRKMVDQAKAYPVATVLRVDPGDSTNNRIIKVNCFGEEVEPPQGVRAGDFVFNMDEPAMGPRGPQGVQGPQGSVGFTGPLGDKWPEQSAKAIDLGLTLAAQLAQADGWPKPDSLGIVAKKDKEYPPHTGDQDDDCQCEWCSWRPTVS